MWPSFETPAFGGLHRMRSEFVDATPRPELIVTTSGEMFFVRLFLRQNNFYAQQHKDCGAAP